MCMVAQGVVDADVDAGLLKQSAPCRLYIYTLPMRRCARLLRACVRGALLRIFRRVPSPQNVRCAAWRCTRKGPRTPHTLGRMENSLRHLCFLVHWYLMRCSSILPCVLSSHHISYGMFVRLPQAWRLPQACADCENTPYMDKQTFCMKSNPRDHLHEGKNLAHEKKKPTCMRKKTLRMKKKTFCMKLNTPTPLA